MLLTPSEFAHTTMYHVFARVGFEKMEKGSLGTKFTDRTNPMEKHVGSMFELREMTAAPMAPQMFGNAGVEHMEKYGAWLAGW